MITHREMMGGAMGAAFAALVAGSTNTLLEAKTLPAQQHGHDQTDASPIKSLMREPLAPTPNPIVDVIMLEMAPGSASGPHQHTGPVFAYILEGEIENQVEPGAAKRYGPGDYFYEPPMHEHKIMKNLSETKPAKLLIFQVEQKDKPFTIAWKNSA
ncbi:MAG: cupin domain-containing protein [Acidobacteriaceae bacterium]